jgi:hypothetical protein
LHNGAIKWWRRLLWLTSAIGRSAGDAEGGDCGPGCQQQGGEKTIGKEGREKTKSNKGEGQSEAWMTAM